METDFAVSLNRVAQPSLLFSILETQIMGLKDPYLNNV